MSFEEFSYAKQPRSFSWCNGLHKFEQHFHDQLFIGVITRGECCFTALGRTYLARVGDVVVIPAFVPHAAHCNMHARYRAAYLDEEIFLNWVSHGHFDGDGLRANVSVSHDPIQANNLAVALDSGDGIAVRQAVTQFLNGRTGMASPCLPRGEAEVVLRRTVSAAAKLQRPMATIAAQFGCSPSAFSRLFIQQVGMRAVFFRNQFRLLDAEDRLLEGGGISEIALDCGYSDQAHLTRDIKKFRGVTPGAYLSSHQPVSPAWF